MEFQFSEDSLQVQQTMRQFMHRRMLPHNSEWQRLTDSRMYPTEVIEPLKALARQAGL